MTAFYMPRDTRAAVVAVFVLLLTADRQGQPAAPPGQIRARVDYVSTDVTVRDSAGRPVSNLTANEFEVFEDNVRQTITSFVPVVGGRALTNTGGTPAPAREGLVLPPSVRTEVQGRIFIVFIDDLHIQFLDTTRTKEYLRKIRDIVLHENDLVGLVSSGYSSIASDLSPDPNHRRFNAAIDKLIGAGKDPREIINANQTADGPSGLRADAFTAFKTAYEILEQAEKVTDRRKAFIYISSGYDFNPFTDSRFNLLKSRLGLSSMPVEQGTPTGGQDPLTSLAAQAGSGLRNPYEMNGLQFANADLLAAIGELVSRARRANVTFYPVDPRGLVAGPDIASNLSQEEYTKFVNNSLSTLDAIAGGTGGFCVCRDNDITKGLQRIDNDMSDYYVIGYESTNPDPLKDVRRIEIKVKRPGVVLTYKDRYSLKKK